MTALSASTTVVDRRRRQGLVGAKHSFMNVVNEGVEKLMHRYGYSRDRATATLLRELASGESGPTDDEVFHIMKVQRVGLDEASQALTVSKAMKRAMKDRGISAVEAIDDLTTRLSLANFSIFSEDKVDDQIDEKTEIQRPRTPTALKKMMTPASATTDKQRTQPPSSRKITSSKKSAKVKVETLKGKTPVVTKPSRKRALSGNEQEGSNQGESKGRARSDSVTEVVNAKMAAVDTGAVEASKPVAVRGKRRVPEDSKPAAAAQPIAKRPRVGEA